MRASSFSFLPKCKLSHVATIWLFHKEGIMGGYLMSPIEGLCMTFHLYAVRSFQPTPLGSCHKSLACVKEKRSQNYNVSLQCIGYVSMGNNTPGWSLFQVRQIRLLRIIHWFVSILCHVLNHRFASPWKAFSNGFICHSPNNLSTLGF